ncbi:MAG: hypothetical protein ASARMPREDX12_005978 [Alectoria sarmentosa]|nr:MAG: hypothetical protein ASARMPREDX12_005978 [Alectoria sarmentosa]
MELLGDFEEAIWGEKALWVVSKDSDRVMVVWEEFLDMMCHDSAILTQRNPARVDERGIEGREDRVDAGLLSALRDQVSRLRRRSEVRIGLFFFFFTAGVAIAIAGLLWDFPRTGEDILIAMIRDLKASMEVNLEVWGCGYVVGAVMIVCGIPWGFKTVFGAVVFGLALRLLVYKAEVLVGSLAFVRENS